MKKVLVSVGFVAGVLLLFSPLATSAQSLSQLQADLAAALAKLQALSHQGLVLGVTDDYPDDPTTGTYCPNLTVTMKRGARDATTGGQVSELQKFLSDYYDIEPEELVTGYFGRITEGYVIKFQRETGLPSFGIVGSMTRAKIAEVCGGGSPNKGLTVVYPNGGEQLDNSGAKDSGLIAYITWSNVGIGDMSISIALINTEGRIVKFIGQNLRNTGTFPWKYDSSIPNGKYRIMVSTEDKGPSAEDYSDNYFMLSGNQAILPAVITITAPNGGEQWEEGIMNTVTWTPYQYNPDINPSKDVTAYLERSTYNGNFETLGKVQENGKASIHWSTGLLNAQEGSEKWAPPGDYYIRVVNNVTGATDRSNSPFTILPRSVDLKVDGSDGPVQVGTNQKVWVSWTSTGHISCALFGAGDTIDQSQIFNLSTSGKREVYPHFYTPGYNTTITMQCTKQNGTVATDSVIVNPGLSVSATIRVMNPNGGEQIPLNQEYHVRTESAGVNMASLALYKNDQWMKWLFKDNVTSPGVHDWSWIPDTEEGAFAYLGNVFKIYITGKRMDGTGYVDDKSDAPFSFASIVSPDTSIQITAPNGGETFTIGTTYNTGDMMSFKALVHNPKTKGDAKIFITSRNDDTWPSALSYFVMSANGYDPLAGNPLIIAGSSQISNAYAPGQYYLLVEWRGYDGTFRRDFSDTTFTLKSPATISPPNIRLSSPTGGNFISGNTIPITWSSDNAPANTGVALWIAVPGPNGAQDFALLNPGPPATPFPVTGTYNWPVPPGWSPGTYNIHAILLTPGSPVGCNTGSCILASNWTALFTINTGTVQPSGVVITPGGQPGNSTAKEGDMHVPFTKFVVTNRGPNTEVLLGFIVKRTGAANQVFSSIELLNETAGGYAGTPTPLDSNGQAIVGGVTTMLPGTSMTFAVVGNMSSNVSGYVGQGVSLNLVGVNGSTLGDSTFPIVGPTHIIISSGTNTTATLVPLPTEGLSDGRLLRYKLTAGSSAASFSQFNFQITGINAPQPGVYLRVYNDSSFSQPVSSLGPTGVFGSQSVPGAGGFYIANPNQLYIPPGVAYYFELTSGGSLAVPSVTTSMVSAGGISFMGITQTRTNTSDRY